MIKLVIVDLDGTLLNTIADPAQSTNYALRGRKESAFVLECRDFNLLV